MSERDLLGLTASDRQFIKYLVGLGKATGLLPEQVKKGRPAIPRRVRKAARFCETIADTYGVYVPNEPLPERILKADPVKKVKPHFTNTEIREMGLKWVTVHPNNAEPGKPVLVQDLGDEYVVVGGAGGSMNFTRFKKDKKYAGEAKKDRKKREKPELSEEERAKQEAKLAEATDQTKKAKRELRERVSEIIGGVPGISEDDRKELEAKAIAEAKRLNTSEAGQKDFVQQALKQHEQRRKEAADKAIDDAISAVNEAAGVEALTGQPAEPPMVSAAGDGKAKPAKLPFTPEQFTEIKSLVAEEANAIGHERSLKRALNQGGEAAARALELHYKPLSAEEQSQYFADRHLEAEKIRANKALLDATSDPNKAMTKHVLQGAADAGAGIAAAACGSTVLDSQTAQELGTAGAAQVIAQYIAEKTGSPDKAAKALREFIGTESAATAGAAVKASMDLAERADAMIDSAKDQGLLNSAQANAKVLQYRNEADRVLGRALGSLETAAQVALHLERGTPAKLVVPGRSSEAGTRDKAKELGLVNTQERATHSVRKGEHGWELHITPEGIRDLYREQSIDQYAADAEVQEIKRRSWGEGWEDEQGNPWSVEGQSDDIILQPHQQGNIKLWERQKNILVTDEAGSGKTAVALCGIAHLASQGKVKKALVVVPATVGAQFGDEIKKFLGPEHQGNYAIASGMSKRQRDAAYSGDQLITVITHDALRNDFEAIKAAGFDCMAVDEAHYFTTRGENEAKGSLRSQKARELDMPYKMLMTGTPVKNDLSELHSLADWLQPGCLGSRREFMARYGKLATSAGMFDEGLKRSLQQRLSGVATGITLSVEKDEDGKPVFELRPGKTGAEPIRCREETLWTDLSPQQAEAYRTTEKAYLDARKAGQKVNPLARDQEHKRTCNNLEIDDHPKVELLRGALAKHPGERAVIFAQNQYSHRAIIDGLSLQEGEYAVIDGSMPSAKRNAIAKQLADPNSPLKHVICSDAANFGLNMQGASVLVNWDATDTYACHRQRIAREFRKGQTRDVTVYNMRTNTPYEQTAQERIASKKKQQDLTQSLVSLDESGLYSIFAEHLGGS